MPKSILTQQDKDTIIELFKAGNPVDYIATEFGVSRSTVRRVLAQEGLAINRAEATRTERALLDVLQTLNINDPNTLVQRLSRGY